MATPSVCSYRAPLNWNNCPLVDTFNKSTRSSLEIFKLHNGVIKSPKRQEIISLVFACLCITKSLLTIMIMIMIIILILILIMIMIMIMVTVTVTVMVTVMVMVMLMLMKMKMKMKMKMRMIICINNDLVIHRQEKQAI